MDVLKTLLVCLWCTDALEAGFQEDVARLLRRVRMSPERINLASLVLRDVNGVLQTRWPGTEVTPYGSVLAGLGDVTSDLDFSIEVPGLCPDLNAVKSVMDHYSHLFTKIRAIPARVPIVKFIHVPTGHSGDISFRNRSGVNMTAFLKYIMSLDDRVLDLSIIVRHWAKLHKPIRSGHGRIMSNTAMVSLVIFYLQQIKVLPSITLLQENSQKIMIDDWNMGFDEIPHRSSNNASVYDLLGGFFQYFVNFDFDTTVVSTYIGYPIQKNVFKNIESLPMSYKLYKLNKGIKPLNITSPVVISDAFILNQNIAQEVTRDMLVKFKSDLKFATEAYSRGKDDFLQVIIKDSTLFSH